jgi:hypothetical protein
VTIWFLLRRWPATSARAAWATGAQWAVLTILFETAMGRAAGRSWGEVLGQYALWRGSLWPLLLLWILVAPAALSSLQRAHVAVGATLAWAVIGWGACGGTFGLARAALGVEAAIWIHLAAAPLIGALATRLLWRHRRHPGVTGTALAMAGVPAFLDSVVVAPFLERSYAMFQSAAGTWIPLALILVASAGTAVVQGAKPNTTSGSRPPSRSLGPYRLGRNRV